MQPNQSFLEEIKSLFYAMDSLNDFSSLLNRIYQAIFPNRDLKSIVQITPRDLNYYAFDRKKHKYKTFQILKKSGGIRIIKAPTYKLKTILKCINWLLNTLYTPHHNSYGFVIGKNIAKNATPHIGKQYVYNIDLLDFFTSTNFRRIKAVLQLAPFYLNDKNTKLLEREKLGFLIANICCDEGSLPQGAPTSPTFTNIVCRRLDKKLYSFAKKNKCSFTRYADDITFSSYDMVFNKSFKDDLHAIIVEENYKTNESKERLQTHKERQVVTGLVVNQKVNTTKEFTKDIRFWLWLWETKGADKTQEKFKTEFISKKSYVKYKGKAPSFINYLYGKIQFFNMIRGSEDIKATNYLKKFKELLGQKSNSLTTNQLLEILRKIDRDGKESINYSLKNIVA